MYSFCLASFTHHNHFEINPCCCMYAYFISFFYCSVDSTVWIYHIWAVFHLGILWIKLVWTFMYKYLCKHMFSILLDTRSITAWSYSKCTFNFIRNCQIIFQNICIILHSNQEINFCDLNLKGLRNFEIVIHT